MTLLLLLGCARGIAEGGEDPAPVDDSATDTDTPPSDDTGEPVDPICVDAPVVTWNNFGEGFLVENCQACHASTAPNRHDAPESVTFDTEEDVRTWKDRILARAAGDAPTMPPMGGTSPDDRYLLEVWLTCWLDYWEEDSAR